MKVEPIGVKSGFKVRGAIVNVSCIVMLSLLLTKIAEGQDIYDLQKALHATRISNLTLKTEYFNIDIARADVTTVHLRPNPSLNNQTLQLTDSKYYPRNTNWHNASNRQVWWQLTKTFQLPNQRKYKIELAEKALHLETLSYREAERNVLFDAANKWLAAVSAQKSVASLQKAKAIIDTLVRINRLRFKNLVISETDVIRTELLANQYELQIKTAQQESVNKLRELKLALNVSDSIQINLNDSIDFRKIPVLDSLLDYSLNNRADIQEANAALSLHESNSKLQRSLAIPQPILGGIWNPQNTIPYLGFYGTIDIPVFYRNQGEILKSDVRLKQVMQNIIAVQTLIQQQVRSSHNSFIINHQNLKKFERILKDADAVLESVRYAYLKGATPIVDVLEAQRSRLDIQRQYGAILKQHRQNYIELLFYTGLINLIAR